MSLINDVLKDLDNKPDNTDSSMLGLMQSTSARKQPKSSMRWVILIVLIAVVALGAVWGYLTYTHQPPKLKVLGADSSVQASSAKPTVTASEVASSGAAPVIVAAKVPQTITQTAPQTVAQPVAPAVAPQSVSNEPAFNESASSQSDDLTVKPARVEQTLLGTEHAQAKPVNPEPVKTEQGTQAQVAQTSPKLTQVEHGQVEYKQVEYKQVEHMQVEHKAALEESGGQAPVESEEALVAERGSETAPVTSVSKSKTLEVRLYEQSLLRYQQGRYAESELMVDQLLDKERLSQDRQSLSAGNEPKYQALKARLLLKESPAALVDYIDQNKVDIAASDELLGLVASAFQRSGDHIRAIKAYDLLVQRQPTEGRWWLAMAFSLEAEKVLDKSLKAYSFALQSGNLPANAREFAASKANQISKQLEALAKQAKEQE